MPPGEEKGRGYFEDTWLDKLGEDGTFSNYLRIKADMLSYGKAGFL